MRAYVLILTALTCILTAMPFAGASHSAECPTYTFVVGDDTSGVGVSDEGHVLVSTGSVYLFVDEVASDGYVYSIWLTFETNGEPGPQRHDDYCGDPGVDGSNNDQIYGF